MPRLADSTAIEDFLNRHAKIVEPTLFAEGDVIGEWQVVAFVGRGGSGEVYCVRHVHLGVSAAMKVLARDDSAARNRFVREARILVSHAHPAFPRFLGYGESEGRPYLVIELLEPLPLPNTDRAVARYLCKVCEGVCYLHGLGLVHRDIKPQNVLQRGDSGQPVLIDLGLVKDTSLSSVHGGASLSIVDGRAVGVGTPKYAAPEQFAGGEISPAADIHALGMLVNECFGGHPPRAWERIIRRSTSSIPAQRYHSVKEFVRAVRNRHALRSWALGVACLLAVAACTVAWGFGQHLPHAPSDMVRIGAADSETMLSNAVMHVGLPAAVIGVPEEKIPSATTIGAQSPGSMSIKHDVSSGEKGKYPRAGAYSGDTNIDSNF